MMSTHQSQSKIKYMEMKGDFCQCRNGRIWILLVGSIYLLPLWGFRSFVRFQSKKEHFVNTLYFFFWFSLLHSAASFMWQILWVFESTCFKIILASFQLYCRAAAGIQKCVSWLMESNIFDRRAFIELLHSFAYSCISFVFFFFSL